MVNEQAKRKEASYILVLLVLSYFFFFFNLGSYSLKEPDEGRYAEIPREMVEQGNYMVPHLNYVRYFEKPPLIYWVTAASYKLFGINEWSFRFPNALAAFACSILLYLFARRRFSCETGFFGAAILISCFGFFAMARIVTIDMLFTGLLFGALLSFYEYYRTCRRPFFYLFYVCLALATLAKGPAALVLMGITVLIYLVTEKRLSFLRDLLGLRGILVFVVITMPWFIAMSIKEKEFFQFFFIDQHVLRFVTTKHKRSGPLYYFIPVLAAGMLPWSVFLPRIIIKLWRIRELRFFFIWSAVVFVFFSISGSKLPPYILPIFPPVALVIGHFFASQRQELVSVNREIIVYIIFFIAVMMAGLFGASGVIGRYMEDVPYIQDILPDLQGFEVGIILFSATLICLLCINVMRHFGSLFYILTGFSLVVIIALMFHTQVIDRYSTTKDLAKMIANFYPQTAHIVNYGSFHETLPFYTQRRINIAEYRGELAMGSKYPDARPFFLDEEAFGTLFDSGQPVLAVTKEKNLSLIAKAVHQRPTLLGCQDATCLITNQSVQLIYRSR
jgi:hypothetical protein